MDKVIVNASGSVVTGQIVNDAFVVQHGPDFDCEFEVYGLDEITLLEEATRTELDNDFSDYLRCMGD